MSAAQPRSPLAWCRSLFTDVLFPGTADADTRVRRFSLLLLIVLPASYLSFGLAHRLVRAEVGGLPVEPEKQRGMLRRMRGAAWLAVVLTVWVTWLGLRLTQTLRAMPPAPPPSAGAVS